MSGSFPIFLKRVQAYLFGALCLFSSAMTYGQALRLEVCWAKDSFQLNHVYFLPTIQDSLSIETFKFYLHDIQLFNRKKLVASQQKHQLMDAENPESFVWLNEPLPDFDSLAFCFGTDSLVNTSGVMGDDLDPTNGMYWAWQSGYINLKVEGYSPVCNSRNHKFQYHIGGFQGDDNTIRRVGMARQAGIIRLDLQAFLMQMDLIKRPEIMQPCSAASEAASDFCRAFRGE